MGPKKLIFDGIPWKRLKCTKKQLRLDIVLKCGQSFRWEEVPENSKEGKSWIGVLRSKVWQLAQEESHILYRTITSIKDNVGETIDDEETILNDYFQLQVDLEPLYQKWSKNDPFFEKISEDFGGVRILRQDPVENLFSFICSANNNIQRISGMVSNLCVNYGRQIATSDDDHEKTYFAFPEIATLASEDSLESHLRQLGFGYRAGYIAKTAKTLDGLGGRQYLLELRNKPYAEARKNLLELHGIGPKVADCILLMSLDQRNAIPVDTHMFQVAKKYLPHLNQYKSVTDKVYMEIADHFRNLYGDYSGWAHSVLFSADLRHFQSMNSSDKETDKKSRKRKSCQ